MINNVSKYGQNVTSMTKKERKWKRKFEKLN